MGFQSAIVVRQIVLGKPWVLFLFHSALRIPHLFPRIF